MKDEHTMVKATQLTQEHGGGSEGQAEEESDWPFILKGRPGCCGRADCRGEVGKDTPGSGREARVAQPRW